jgi:hypothetical protein
MSSSNAGTMSGLTARLSMYAFGRIKLQMACTDSTEMVSLLSEYVCGMWFRPSMPSGVEFCCCEHVGHGIVVSTVNWVSYR